MIMYEALEQILGSVASLDAKVIIVAEFISTNGTNWKKEKPQIRFV